MKPQIHGHEVMEMILASSETFTDASLAKKIIEKFGADARFYTCSAENMTAAEIIKFLAEKGKFVASGAGFTTLREKICNHGPHD